MFPPSPRQGANNACCRYMGLCVRRPSIGLQGRLTTGYRRPGRSDNRNLFSHSSGGQKSKDKELSLWG